MSKCEDFWFWRKNEVEQELSKFMPWIGFYIAAASWACLLAMAADIINGIRWKQFWIPSRHFSINAVYLTLFAVAIKLSTDLNSTMIEDQKAKTTTAYFICIATVSFTPSLGNLRNHELAINSTALAILITTSAVDLCIQLATKVTGWYALTQLGMISIMLFWLSLFAASAISLPSIKDYVQIMYEKQHQVALKESFDETDETKSMTVKFKDYLIKFSMMAHSGCPQYILARSVTCNSLLAVLLLNLFLFLAPHVPPFFSCHYKSNYGVSVRWIVATQITAVLLCIAFVLSRAHIVLTYGNSLGWQFKTIISMKNYLIQSQIDKKENSFFTRIRYRHCRKVINCAIDAVFYFLIGFQGVATFVAQGLLFILICGVWMVFFPFFCCCRWLFRRSHNEEDTDLNHLTPYVLHLVGEEELVKQMLQSNFRTSNLYITRGQEEQPGFLFQLLTNSLSTGFDGVFSFDSRPVPPLLDSPELPPNCWALPVVTLTSIAVALPKVDRRSVDNLLLGVSEGLLYVNQIEDRLNDSRDMIYAKKASTLVWKGVDLHRKWLDVDLVALGLQESNPREVLKILAASAKNRLIEFLRERNKQRGALVQSASIWSNREMAAHSMYRISRTLLLDCHAEGNESKRIFNKVSVAIADIIGACLTNLKCLILTECAQSSIERRRETAFHILHLFGKAERIIEILEERKIPDLSPDRLAFIDGWRSSHDV